MKYKIYPFLLHNFEDNQLVVQNMKNIVLLHHKDMIEFFYELDKYSYQSLNTVLLSKYFGKKTNDALQFLIDNQLIFEEKNHSLIYKTVNIFSNDECINKSLKFNLEGSEKKINFFQVDIYDMLKLDYSNKSEDLNIFILNPFNYKEIVELTSYLKKVNLMFQMIFYYNNYFYISNYYKEEWMNPCPCCFFSKIESELRAESQMGINTFQTIMDLIYKREPMFQTEAILQPCNILPLINIIKKQISSFDESLLKLVNSLDINTSRVTVDVAMHWELCDCND
jgi:McbB family protein